MYAEMQMEEYLDEIRRTGVLAVRRAASGGPAVCSVG